MTIAAIVVAAGRGRRLGSAMPKQYIPINGVPAIRRSIDAFLCADRIDWVLAVIHPEDQDLFSASVEGRNDDRLLPPAFGGGSRAQSVLNGLNALEEKQPAQVLIHDAARAFVPDVVIQRVIAALETDEGACAALPVVDALWQGEDARAKKSIPREGLWRAQTPQGFRYDRILTAHRSHDGTGADDVAVAREAGLAVRFVEGSEWNYKITTQDDLERAIRDANSVDA